MQYKFVKEQADTKQYQNESNGNQNDTMSFLDIVLDATKTYGTITFGTGASAVQVRTRAGGGIDFYNGIVKIASLDKNGNLRTRGSIIGNTTP